MIKYFEKVEPEFKVGDTVTYMPRGKAYQAEVNNIQFIGAAAHLDEVEYILEVKGTIVETKVRASCRCIYESVMYRRSHDIAWG